MCWEAAIGLAGKALASRVQQMTLMLPRHSERHPQASRTSTRRIGIGGLAAALVVAASAALIPGGTVGRADALDGWTVVASANPSSTENALSGVSCLSLSDCWSVGYKGGTYPLHQTLVEQWNGSSWTAVASPDSSASQSNDLWGISCMSASDCWAVGNYSPTGAYNQTLIEQWNGTSWSLIASPNVSTTAENQLYGVTCVSASDCWAVGYDSVSGVDQTLVEQWSGTSWAIVSSPNTSASVDNLLRSVTCSSASDCLAAGGSGETLIEQWNGTSWGIVASPNVSGSTADTFNGVSCSSASNCWAVGDYTTSASIYGLTLTEQWNRASWSIVSSPNVTTATILKGVACIAASNCWAVGYDMTSNQGDPDETLSEQWDGTSWSIVPSSSNGATGEILQSVSCFSAAECWTVGAFESGQQTLAEVHVGATDTSQAPVSSSIFLGQSDSDVATVIADAYAPPLTGTVSFFVCGPCFSAGGCTPSTSNSVGTPVAVTPGGDGTATATSALFTPSATGTWCFAAEYSADPNYPASTDGDTDGCFTVTTAPPVDDTSPSVSFDTWVGVTDSTANGGTYRASPTKGATAPFKFSGTGITWVTREGPNQGIATVTVDGKNKGNVNLYATTAKSFSKGYSGLTSKSHTIVIRVTGTKAHASTKSNVAVDAFIVGLTTTQETAPAITYDSWTGASSTSASGGTYRTDGKANATSSLTFTGTGITWVTATGPSEVKASESIDGTVVGTVDLYASTVNWQVAESFGGLAAGTHTIVVTVLGIKDKASTGTQVVVDAFIIS
jgi:hypothetical protein